MAIRNFSLALLGFALCAQLALAQVNTATISGTVHDSSGAVLPGANVAIQNQDTGISRTVTTNETGRYSAPALGLGNYRVTAQLQGFQSQVRSGIALTVGREAVVDFTLAVGAVTQTVEVTGEAPLIELSNANLGGLVDDRTIREMPLNSSGTNELHGTLFEFLRNSAFDARTIFDLEDRDGDGKADLPPFRRNQFGGVLGGPIKKDKTFFFGGYEGFRQARSDTTIAVVPTVAAKRGMLPCVAPATRILGIYG